MNERQELHELIKREDLSVFKRILLWSPEISDLQNENLRFLTDDFKNSLIVKLVHFFKIYFPLIIIKHKQLFKVRSTEVLNDLNINPSSKLNKYENFATCQVIFLLYEFTK